LLIATRHKSASGEVYTQVRVTEIAKAPDAYDYKTMVFGAIEHGDNLRLQFGQKPAPRKTFRDLLP
jgi:hypothetical protein